MITSACYRSTVYIDIGVLAGLQDLVSTYRYVNRVHIMVLSGSHVYHNLSLHRHIYPYIGIYIYISISI